MQNFYLSSKEGVSGICKYSRDFYELVLKERGYIFINSNDRVSAILSRISSRDRVHIEIGIFQKKEIELLFLMLKANYRNVSITLHDAPLLKYPFYEFKNVFLNNLSKFFDKYMSGMRAAIPYVKKIRAIYVLTQKGVDVVKKKYEVSNVYHLPHIINPVETQKSNTFNKNLIYFGFIGKNKGIEYSLQLHQQLMSKYPDIHFYVVGKALGKQIHFYNYLKEKYRNNVHYCGYLEEDRLSEVFNSAMFALIPFKDYKFFYPFSGSILYSLNKGKIVLTNNVNSISDIIEDGKNGFFLSGRIKDDLNNLTDIIRNKPLLDDIRHEVYNHTLPKYSPEEVKKSFKE